MTLDYKTIYEECAGQPWSMYDSGIEDEEDLESAMCIAINQAMSYLWNLYPWAFKKKDYKIKTRKDRAEYNAPKGSIEKKTVSDATGFNVILDREYLTYEEEPETLENATGKPTHFYIDGDKICLYPTPDDTYEIKIKYLLNPYGLNEQGDYIYELKSFTDIINISEEYETMFKNCLLNKAMVYAISEEGDENYSAYSRKYEEALFVLQNYCKNKNNNEKRIII